MFNNLPSKAFENPKLGYRVADTDLGVLSFMINILSLALPLLTLQVYDRLLVNGQLSTLYLLTAAVIIILAVEVFLRFARSRLMGVSAASFEYTVSSNVVRHTLQKNTVQNQHMGDFLHSLQAASRLKDFSSGQVMNTFVDVPFLFVYIWLIYYLGGSLVIVPLILLFLMILKAVLLHRNLRHMIMSYELSTEKRYDFLMQVLNYIHTVKSYGLEDIFSREFELYQQDCTETHRAFARYNTRMHIQGLFFSHSMMLVVASLGAYFVIEGYMTAGVLIACVLLSGRIMQPVQKVLGLWTRWYLLGQVKKDIKRFFLTETKETVSLDVENKGEIEFKNVSFYYEKDTPVLQNINFTLKAGQSIALIGDHGAGKNTFLKLAAGIVEPSDGVVRINGVNPYLLDSQVLLKSIGYLPPEGVIFKGTIWDNLSRFDTLPKERIFELVELLDLEKEINRLPAGYETELYGNTTDTLSPGMRQRISLVRVLAEKPRIILYYFADESFDTDGYNALYNLLSRLKGVATFIFVSNDENIIRLADKYYTLDQGRMCEAAEEDVTTELISQVKGYEELDI